MRRFSGQAGAVRSAVATVVVVALAAVGLITAGPASAATGSFSLSPVVGVRTGGPDACAIGPTSGTNCAVTIVVTGTGLPVADPASIGEQVSDDAAMVAIVDNDDGHSGWQAGRLTDTFSTCKVIIGASSDSTLILQVGNLGPTCPGYSIQPGDKVDVILYDHGSEFGRSTATASTPDTDATPLVSDVNPPYGPVSGGTSAAPGTGSVNVASSGVAAPIAAWFGDVATNAITAVDDTHYSVVPPKSSASQDNEGIAVQLADQTNGTSPVACTVLLPGGCADEFMYLSEHHSTLGPTPPFNFNWGVQLAGSSAADSKACGINGASGTSTGLSINGSVTGGGIGLDAGYGLSKSALGIPEALVGSATLNVTSPIVISVSLSGSISACEQIGIPDLSIPGIGGFYFVVGGSVQGSVTLTITINQGTYTLSGGMIPGSNEDDIRGASVTSNCVDGDGSPTTECVTTAVTASLTGTLSVSPLWFQVGPDEANVGAGFTAAAIGTITYPPLAVNGDICVAGNWAAQVNVGPFSGSTGGTFLGPFNIVGDGSICPLGATTGGGSTAPDAPIDLAATPGDGSANLGWTAPASDGGSPITGYNVYEGTGAGAESDTPLNASPLPPDTTSFPVTGLDNGTTYFFTVKAVNDAGESVASNEASATPTGPTGTVPGAPVDLAATAGDGSAHLEWSPPASDGGSAVTGYNVYEASAAGQESDTPLNAEPLTDPSFDVAGLTNGTTYFFTVKAVNEIGQGAASNEASATPSGATVTVPGAPTDLVATLGDGAAHLEWTPPASDGGSAVTGYNVYEGTSLGGESDTPVNAEPVTDPSFDVPGLTDGTTYFFTVTAINDSGEGAASNEASVTPSAVTVDVPGPVAIEALPGDGSATVQWNPPDSDGGSPVTGYNIYAAASAGGELLPVNASPLPPDATSFPVTGLDNGTTYFFLVKAVNDVGEGPASNEASTTPSALAGPPGPPVGLTAAPNVGSTTLRWSPPVSDGGTPITGYNVYEGTSPGGEASTPVNPEPLAASATSFDATGLTDRTTYSFVVQAINAIGEGAPSNEASAAPGSGVTVPGAPVDVTASPGCTSATVNWSAPSFDGGSPITGYDVYLGTSPGGEGAVPVNASPLPATATSLPILGLVDGTTYSVVVRAVNAIGEGASSAEASVTPAAEATVPTAPVVSAATPGHHSVTLDWSAPTSDGGSAISGYNVYASTDAGGELLPVSAYPLAPTSTSYTVTGLTNGTTYFFLVKAVNEVGESDASNEVHATPSSGALPDAPLTLHAYAGNRNVTLKWLPPAPTSSGPSSILGYNVYEGAKPGAESTTPVNASLLPPDTARYRVPGRNDTRYYFVVKAVNLVGEGAASNEAFTTPRRPQAPGPVELQARAGAQGVTLTWAAPLSNGRSPITGYAVFVGTKPGHESSHPVNRSPLPRDATRFTVRGLQVGKTYFFVVEAINVVGRGQRSNEVHARPTAH
ncbi:MAG: fibronectin type III domain-containing protein [Acidimicrobiia bacterium]|nr:fibronectin type III domain-containing protein [Acidimicrobiia bacterium]